MDKERGKYQFSVKHGSRTVTFYEDRVTMLDLSIRDAEVPVEFDNTSIQMAFDWLYKA